LVGLPADRLVVVDCAAGGAAAGLAGGFEVAAVHTAASASVISGLGYSGILVSFAARHQPLAIVPMALLLGGFGAAGSLLQRRLGLPDASIHVLLGFAFVLILAMEAARGRLLPSLLRAGVRRPKGLKPQEAS
jgi:simple sugar transport system permease protein